MTRIILRELYMDIRNKFRGWKLFLFLAYLAVFIIMSMIDNKGSVGYFLMLYSISSIGMMRSKINKLYYLLPLDIKDRKRYLALKSLGIFLFHTFLYFAVILVICLQQSHRLSQELSIMVCHVIPVFLCCCSISIGSHYYWGRGTNKSIYKKCKRKNVYAILLMVVLVLNAVTRQMFFDYPKQYLHGIWLAVVTLLAYLLALICLLLELSILRYTEISEENIRKFEKVF